MAQFYHNSVTDISFRFLTELSKSYNFVLIGGWAVFLYTRSLKSKDIDIILDYNELGKMRENFTVEKNERLKKYEIKTGEFDIDIYVPHYSDIGIPSEHIMRLSKTRSGFTLPLPEVLFVLKLYAWQERRGSIKGRKDELDILSLASLPEFDWNEYLKIVNEFKFQSQNDNFVSFLRRTTRVPELRLNEQQTSRLKKQIIEAIDKK